MHKIVVKHSCIIINDYTINDCKQLENNFTIWDTITHTSHIYSLEYDEKTKQLFLPRGIDIPYLESLFGTVAYIDKVPDKYDKIGEIMLKYKPRDEVQLETLAFIIGYGKYRYTNYKSQLSVNLAPGKGKSYCSIAAMSIFRNRSIVITSSISWLIQWKKYILEYTDIKNNEVIIISSKHTSIYNLMNRDISHVKIILASISSIRSYGDKNGWDAVTEFFKYIKVGGKYYDECHLNFETMAKIDYHTNTLKTIYITATPIKSDDKENDIFRLYFKNVPSISLFNEEEDPHTNYIGVRFKSVPTPEEKSFCRGRFGLDRNKYIDYLVHKENFYKILRVILEIFYKLNNGKLLLYIGTNKAIKVVYDWLMYEYPELQTQIGIYTSIITNNKEEQLNKRVILSTTKSLGAAKDIKNLKMVVLLDEPIKSKVIATQSLGRTRNKNTYYFEIVDTSFNTIYKWYYSKRPLFNKIALTSKEIILDEYTLDKKNDDILRERKLLFDPEIELESVIKHI